MTQIQKQYEWAFLVEPTKLTRIVDTIHERLRDHEGASIHDLFEVFMSGNRREELTSTEDLLALDNSTRHRIARLIITSTAVTPGAAKPEHEVQVDFAAPKPNSGTTISISTSRIVGITVRSEAPGWASRTLSQVEEKVERTWLPHGRPIALLILLFCAVTIFGISQFVSVQPAAAAQYMWLHDSDVVRIQALLAPNHIITDEEAREVLTMQLRNVTGVQYTPTSPQHIRNPPPLILGAPLVLLLGCIFVLLLNCYPSAVFLWGDGVERFNRVLQRRKALWGTIIAIGITGVFGKIFYEWVPVLFPHR